jgi:hypothetical protein
LRPRVEGKDLTCHHTEEIHERSSLLPFSDPGAGSGRGVAVITERRRRREGVERKRD